MPRLFSAMLFAVLPAMLFAAFPATAQEASPVADALKAPVTAILKFAARAEGFQIYQCSQDKADPKLYAWNLTGPQADLFDTQGNKIGLHYAGPTWESKDGSKIVGQVKANTPSPDKDAIAWLLLETKQAGGSGAMNGVNYVQRLQTHGGRAPQGGCNEKTAGTSVNAPYTAMYYFYQSGT